MQIGESRISCLGSGLGFEHPLTLNNVQDTLSILEKRVRSRCQSQVHQMILPADFSSYLSLSAELMGVDSELWNAQGDEEGKLAAEWEGEVTVSRARSVEGGGSED